MFRKMRRRRQQLPREEALDILRRATAGVLALGEEGGYPYAVPVSYVCSGEKIYFHSAVEGHKVDLLRKCGKVSMCVIERDDVRPGEFTTYFRSVIIFGSARIIADPEEKLRTLRLLGERFSPGREKALATEIERGFSHLLMVEISIDHITGKEAIELVRGRK